MVRLHWCKNSKKRNVRPSKSNQLRFNRHYEQITNAWQWEKLKTTMDSVHWIVSFEFFTLQQVLSRNSKSAEASIEHSFNTYGKRYRHVYGFSISYFQILPTKNIFIYFSFYCNLMMLVLFFHGMFLFLIFCLLLLYYFAHSISRISPYFPQFSFVCKLFYYSAR